MKTLSKVFLCLRTHMYPSVKDEHITLKYYDDVSWKELMDDAQRFNRHIPDTVMVKDYGTWSTEKEAFVGARLQQIGLFDEAALTMPHITMERRVDNYGREEYSVLYAPGDSPFEVIDTLWLGKKINGKLEYMPIDTRAINPVAKDYLYT